MLKVVSLSSTECTKSLHTLIVSSKMFNKLALCTVQGIQGERCKLFQHTDMNTEEMSHAGFMTT